MTCGCPSLRAHPRLLAVAIGLPVLEALILGAIGTPAAQALASQATAPAPFGVFHDLRWLLVFHPSWLAFAFELVALIAFRSALTALLVRAAWPRGMDPPGGVRLMGGSVVFTIVSALVLAPFAALLLGAAVVSLSWLFFVAVPCVLGVAALLHHGAVVPTWWRERPPGRTVAWVLFTFLVLTLTSAAVVLAPAPLRPVAAGAAGLFNAWAWFGIVHALSCGERSRRFVLVAPVGIAALVGVVAVGASVGFSVATRDRGLQRVAHGTSVDYGRPVLLVSGFGSHYGGDDGSETSGGETVAVSGQERRFSYAGAGTDGRPRPYRDVDTFQDLSRSVHLMAQQVEAFHADVGELVTIVAESEGALVAKAYLMSHADAPVDALVLLSPLVEPGGVYFPPSGEEGWGVAGGMGLRWITDFVRAVSPFEVSADDGLFRSLIDNAPALRGLFACPVAGVDQLVLLPLADAVVGPDRLDGVHHTVVPAFHGGLADNASVQRTIRTALDGGAPPATSVWDATDTLIRAGATAWRAPTLPVSVNPAWEAADESTGCADIASLVTAWVS
jgi:hypothetical protein